MMGKRPAPGNADEWDVVTGWRRLMTWRPGQVRNIKRRIRRHERRLAKEDLVRECRF